MSGSITESDASASEFDESWTPQQGKLLENYKFQWEPPWKNLNIKIRLANGTTSEHTSFLLVPIKMQFLMKHSLSKIHQIIHSTKCCQIDSINSSKEHLEIKVNSSVAVEIFNEVETYLVNEVDEVLLKPIQRLPYTSKLAEEYFKQGLKERSIDMLCDDSKIYIVGHSEQKDYINKGIEEIKRVTVTKILKMDEKWKIEAVKAFDFIDILTGTFPDILARIQPGHNSIFMQGKDVTIEKAEKEMKRLLSDLFNQKIQLDPLVLQLLTCKQASEMLTGILEKDRIQVVWTIDKTELCFFSKFIINVDVLKSVLHEHFLTAGFSNSSQQSSTFCLSNAFLEITKTNEDRLLVFETTRSGINIAATKQIILELLHREKMFYTDSKNTRGVQVDEVSSEIQRISLENIKIIKKSDGLELRCKRSEDRCNTLERELHSEEEKSKRLAFEKHVLEETNRGMNSETTKQLNELRDLCDVQNSKSISQHNEIESLKTTNEKLVDNLKIVNDDKTKQEEKNNLKIPNTDTVVNIQAKLNISANVFLVESKQRIRNLKRQSGVDVYTEDDGAITLVGNLRSISSSLDKLLQWTNETSDVKLATERQSTRNLKSSSQERALEVGGKSSNVSGASGGCQYPGHKMYPNLFMESGNMFDEQSKQSKEPISPSPDTFKDLKYFPIVGDDSLMMTTKEGIKVYVYQGNLCYLNVQGIVSSSNKYMNHSSGLLSVIAKEAGEKMLDECRGYLDNNSKLQQGKVCVTTAGNLKHYSNVLHVCTPVWAQRKDTESYIEELMNVIRTALMTANDNKLRSIAIAAIGSGHGKAPPQAQFTAYPKDVIDFSRKYGKNTSIKEIHFVDIVKDANDYVKAAFLYASPESHPTLKEKIMRLPSKAIEIFKPHIRFENQAGKFLEYFYPDTKLVVIACDGVLLKALKHTHVKNIAQSEGFGEWPYNGTGVIITEDVQLSGKSQSSKKCLERGGVSYRKSYNSLGRVERNVGSAIGILGDEDLEFNHAFCVFMPSFNEKVLWRNSRDQTKFFNEMNTCFRNSLVQAERMDVKHLAMPVLGLDMYDIKAEWFLRCCISNMLIVIKEFAELRKRKEFMIIHIVVNGDEKVFQILHKEMHERNIETQL